MKTSKKIKVSFIILTLCMATFLSTDFVFAASTTSTQYIMCGSTAFPAPVASMTRTLILLLQIVVPLGIVIMGSLDFLKATIAGDSDKMKKNQKQFISRLIAGAITFFIFVIVKLVVSLIATDGSSANLTSCLDCLINDKGTCDTQATSPFQPDADNIGSSN